MISLGIDPGITGAVGGLKNGQYLAVFDIPSVAKGSGVVKREIDPAGLAREISARIDPKEYVEVLLERVSAMPGQGVSSVFSLGDSYGACRSVPAILGLPVTLVPPAVWKKHFHLGRDKEESRALAVRLFPTADLSLKKHADRAEALLMARYLYEVKFK